MSYLEALSRLLGRRGIRGRLRERILLELDDHLRCEPEARLGDPEELSAHFADELGGERARRAALVAFGSPAVVGLAVAVTEASLTSYPDVFSGSSIALAALAGLCVFAVSQVAFVAGSLALLQSLRLRGRPSAPAAEVDLLRRRTGVALGSGGLVALGLTLYAVNFWGRLPAWWATLNLAAAGGCALLVALGALAHTRAGGSRSPEREGPATWSTSSDRWRAPSRPCAAARTSWRSSSEEPWSWPSWPGPGTRRALRRRAFSALPSRRWHSRLHS